MPGNRLVRALCRALVGALVGFVQYRIALTGERRAAAVSDLAGLNVTIQWGLLFIAVSLVLIPFGCWLLRMRWWALPVLPIFVLELLLSGFLDGHRLTFGLHGDDRAAIFVLSATVVTAVLAAVWPPREPVERPVRMMDDLA